MATANFMFTDRPISYVMLGRAGTAGDLMYDDAGSAMTLKGSSGKGTGLTDQFLGVLLDTTAAGSYGAIQSYGVVKLAKHASTELVEVNDIIYGTHNANTVGTLAGGTAIGICVKQSATDQTYVEVELLPNWITGAGGFHA